MVRPKLSWGGSFRALIAAALVLLGGVGCQEEDGGALRMIFDDTVAGDTAFAPCGTPEDELRATRELLTQINRERTRRGIDSLKRNDTLDKIAAFYACRMIDGNFFSHRDPFDRSRIDTRAQDFGYAFQKVGENLAAGQWSVEQVMREWMDSEGHRNNILDPTYTEVGLSVRLGGKHGIYWVQEFGRPLNERPIDLVAAETTEADQGGGSGESPSDNLSPADFEEAWYLDEY